MARKRDTAAQIIGTRREAEGALAQGDPVAQGARRVMAVETASRAGRGGQGLPRFRARSSQDPAPAEIHGAEAQPLILAPHGEKLPDADRGELPHMPLGKRTVDGDAGDCAVE